MNATDWGEWSAADFEALPLRNWLEESVYDSVMVLTTARTHDDSGFRLFEVIGIRDGAPVERVSDTCDVINWPSPVRMEIFGAGIHVWPIGKSRLKVTHGLSTVDFVREEIPDGSYS